MTHQQHVGRTTDEMIYIITVRYVAVNQLQTEHIWFHILKCTPTCSNRISRWNSWGVGITHPKRWWWSLPFLRPHRAFRIFSTDIPSPLTSIPPVMFVSTYFAMWVRMVNTPGLDAGSASTVPVLICVHGVASLGLAPASLLIADIDVGRFSHHNMEQII